MIFLSLRWRMLRYATLQRCFRRFADYAIDTLEPMPLITRECRHIAYAPL